MKTIRILAAITLGLISLMNVGYPFSTDPKPSTVLGAGVLVLGLAGLVAAFGLLRNATWGVPAALVVAGVNVVGALVAMADHAEGAGIGLAVSVVALGFASAAGARRRTTSSALTAGRP